jgi:hypothetical protein
MLKVLGQDIKDLEERKNFLIDNADAVVEIDYHKSFESDELAQKEREFAKKSIRVANLEEEISKFKEKINEELKPLREETKTLLSDIKSKGRLVHEKCYQILDEEERMVGIYNAEGFLISSRPATKDELQKTIFHDLREKKDGTNN